MDNNRKVIASILIHKKINKNFINLYKTHNTSFLRMISFKLQIILFQFQKITMNSKIIENKINKISNF